MSYTPTKQKLEALGFKEQFQNSGKYTSDFGGILIVQAGEVALCFTRSRSTEGDYEGSDGVVYFKLPSEQFFDQLLIAIGWA